MASRSSFEKLPLELIQTIMCTLPDVSSLKSLVSSRSFFYHTFKARETQITTRVLMNELHHDVLPEAVALLEVAKIRSSTDAKQFLSKQLHECSPEPPKIMLSDAFSISNFYRSAEFFSEDVAINSLKKLTRYGVVANPPSPMELARIQRGVYRYQSYSFLWKMLQDSKVYRDPDLYPLPPRANGTWEWMFESLWPCEHEQGACTQLCVCERMRQSISPPFNPSQC